MFHHPVRRSDRESEHNPRSSSSRDRHSDHRWIHRQSNFVCDPQEIDVHGDRREECEEQMEWERQNIQEWTQEEIHQRKETAENDIGTDPANDRD